MANYHYDKWMIKTLLGSVLLGGAVFFMYYSLTHLHAKEKWILFGLISALAVAGGALLLSSAAVNKVKSDLIKKQKMRQQSG